MNKVVNSLDKKIIYGVPVLLISILLLIVQSPSFQRNSDILSLGITLDLFVTIPLIHFFLIRKTPISNFSISKLIVLNIFIASILIPVKDQFYFHFFKIWVFPILEITFIGIVIFNLRKLVLESKNNSTYSFDFFTALKQICYKTVPKKLAMPLATEMAVFYYGFIHWKKKPLRENEFSYHKNSTIISVLIGFLMSGLIELFVIHKLLLKVSTTAAWILTLLSAYTLIQIYGFIRSIPKRPVVIEKDYVFFRYGILSEATIAIRDIESIELSTKRYLKEDAIIKLSPFGKIEEHNIIVHLKKENTRIGFYGIKKKFKTLALYVDNEQKFKTFLNKEIEQLKIKELYHTSKN